MRVNVVCRNYKDDRVLPRFSRYLADNLGWHLTASPAPDSDVVYLSGYFEAQLFAGWPDVPVAAYFTHREEEPAGNAKAKLFDGIAERVNLRVATAPMYAEILCGYGPTARICPPVERERFVIPKARNRSLVAGVSGYTYRNGRKGEGLVDAVIASKPGKSLHWKASGRGWPVPTERYTWADMPRFYQSLDILVCPSLVEGVPMPPLEALSCGVSVVIPRGVGLLDELPDVPGIHRYERGDPTSLISALEVAAQMRAEIDRDALRAATENYSIEAWCDGHKEAIELLLSGVDGGMQSEDATPAVIVEVEAQPDPVEAGTESTRGIYCVAFGDPARACALRMMESAKTHMPEIPIALCASKPIGPEDVLITQPDSDVGGRRAKLRAYELAPAEWESVLYLDADTEVVAPIYRFFEWIEDGWEFVICKDPHLMDTMHNFRRSNNLQELEETAQQVHTLHTLQYNGGVWAFGRNKRIARFFARWLKEWEVHAQRDQGALIRAMYTEPLKVFLLGNEWNTFEKYCKGITTAGLMHYPGDARRWNGMIPGRIDSPEAWNAVRKFKKTSGGKR